MRKPENSLPTILDKCYSIVKDLSNSIISDKLLRSTEERHCQQSKTFLIVHSHSSKISDGIDEKIRKSNPLYNVII